MRRARSSRRSRSAAPTSCVSPTPSPLSTRRGARRSASSTRCFWLSRGDDMEPAIKRLTLKRFRSIPSESIVFDNPTIFVGRNGSGKTNLVSAFSFLAEAMAAPLQAVFDKAGGISTVRNRSSGKSYPPNLGLRADFGRLNGRPGSGFYSFEVRALPNYGFSVVREQCSVSGEGGAHWW